MITEVQRERRRALGAAYRASHKEESADYRAQHVLEQKTNAAAWYDVNRDAILEEKAKESAKFTEWLQVLRTNNGCEDCGTHEGLLEHHHVDPDTKLYVISRMYSFSLDTLEDELEKCVVLCRSCHMKRHVAMKQTEEEGSNH